MLSFVYVPFEYTGNDVSHGVGNTTCACISELNETNQLTASALSLSMEHWRNMDVERKIGLFTFRKHLETLSQMMSSACLWQQHN